MAGDGALYRRKANSKFYFIYNTGKKNERGKHIQKWIDLGTTDVEEAKNRIKLIRAEKEVD
ncbi:hypothetical protein EDC14_10169 [Hydrogenispora ethanolica]|uniref:Uncharacterized protein n=1 Tax=Hydrogenispora ethanolica TaxID=1082276 RepID=A0A4R1RJB0_HYDET|nr:hypothetical protein [Hydrogenispora ethanolica]TCL65880.1 hypothetical protein EDC14_10169 [Hydrogenispora ethanolica]